DWSSDVCSSDLLQPRFLEKSDGNIKSCCYRCILRTYPTEHKNRNRHASFSEYDSFFQQCNTKRCSTCFDRRLGHLPSAMSIAVRFHDSHNFCITFQSFPHLCHVVTYRIQVDLCPCRAVKFLHHDIS